MVGRTLSHYEILEPLGAGGMGEVYLAEDTRLGRKVAIKVLPDEFASIPERLARFEQEARAAAALNHPHIAVVHDVGCEAGEDGSTTHFIVQEYLVGHTLGTELNRGAMPADIALAMAAEIAEALIAAHGAGIIHRDLKPDNIFVTESGHAKVLDFGLAKLGEAAAADKASASMSPTMLGTVAGQVMGTAGYMAPEQIEAPGEIDGRADLFALGCVMYQMVSGRQPFAGKSVPDTLSQVLHHPQAPLIEVDDTLPAELDRIISKCLTKDPSRRYQDADDVNVDVRELRTALEAGRCVSLADVARARTTEEARSANASRPGMAGVIAITLVTALVTALAGWILGSGEASSPPAPVRFRVETGTIDLFGAASPVVVSPDGRTIVYVSIAGGTGRLMAHSVDGFESRELPSTEGAQSPFFSPDGEWVGFFSGNAMRRVPLSGGAVQSITQVPTDFGSADWVDDQRILTTSWTMGLGILEVPAVGGAARELVPASMKPADMIDFGFLNPQSLGDAGRVLFQSTAAGAPVGLYDPGRNDTRFLRVGTGLGAHYVPTGHLLWVADGSLFAAAIDLDAFELTSTPVAVVDNVAVGRVSAFDVSDSGTLVYVAGAGGSGRVRMISVDRSGAMTTLSEDTSNLVRPVVSPDGRSLLVADQGREGYELFVYDLVRGGRRSVAASPLGIWTPDGAQTVYVAQFESSVRFARRALDGSGSPEPLGGEATDNWWPTDVSPDGRWLAFYDIESETSRDIWIMDLDDPEHPVQAVLATPANERSAVFSPDGRWLAYVSDESGRDEVYVRPAPPGTGGAFPLSTAGGREPVWARDGSEIFYRRGDQMVSLPLTVGEELVPGEETVLFTGNFAAETGGRNQFYGVTPDARHFIMVESGADSNHVNVVMNWFEELERLVPAGQ